MKFLNINTGYSFDALWTENQSKGYIFWFPNEQSIDLTYTMPIVIITDESDGKVPLTLTIEDNDIFSFIQLDENLTENKKNIKEYVDGYVFDGKPKFSNTIEIEPEYINSFVSDDGLTHYGNKYAYAFNISCCSNNANEYICKINIKNKTTDKYYGYIRVGADFYGENEAAYINLSNMGTEISTNIQKAIYDTNVHEDIIDNILINRKFKELLSNYWDIIANKGSFKSLKNSFKWFEWNNNIKLKEIYKHYEANKILFSDKDITTILTNSIEDNLNSFAKTTYISLYCALQNELPSYNNEYNPNLEPVIFKWTTNDIKLKIALFAKFFGLYFLPIHVSILHATAEDKVFTNTIKTIHCNEIRRNDNFYDFEYVESNIKDNDIFKLGNVSAQVTSDTVFGIQYPNTNVFGVDPFPTNSVVNSNNIKTFSQQYYTGPGVIIPINIVIPNRIPKDFIKKTFIEYTDDNNNLITIEFNTIFKVIDKKIDINFNFLAKKAKNYNLKFTFIFGTCKTVTRNIKFIVEDVDNLNINIYKIKAKNDNEGLTIEDFYDKSCSKYLFKIQKNNRDLSNSYYMQYLPYINYNHNDYKNYNGIKLNHTVIIDVKQITDNNILTIFLEKINELYNYLNIIKYDSEYTNNTVNKTTNINYITFISRKFNSKATYNDEISLLNYLSEMSKEYFNNKLKVIRNELVFYPQFHYLEKLDGKTIDNFTVSQYEALCCAAEIENIKGNKEDFRYSHLITGSEWKFYNHLTNKTIDHPSSSQKPFIANDTNILEPGYYDVSFKYSLSDGTTNEVKLDSAFRIK